MATVTQGREKIKELQTEIDQLEDGVKDAQEKVNLAKVAAAKRYAQMRDLADSLAGDYQINGSPAATTTATPKRRGRPPGSKNVRVAVKKKRGRPKGSKNVRVAVKKKSAKKKVAKKATTNPMLKACLGILGDKRKWRKHNPELPKGSEGLSVVELRRSIKGNELWPEDAGKDDLHDALTTLREEEKVELIEGRRYQSVK